MPMERLCRCKLAAEKTRELVQLKSKRLDLKWAYNKTKDKILLFKKIFEMSGRAKTKKLVIRISEMNKQLRNLELETIDYEERISKLKVFA